MGKVSPGGVVFQDEVTGFLRTYGLDFEHLELVCVCREGGYAKNPHVQAENAMNGDDPNPQDIPEVDDPSDYLWKRYDDGRLQNPSRYQERCTSFFAYRVRLSIFETLFPR